MCVYITGTIRLNGQDIREIIAEHINRVTGVKQVTKDNVEFEIDIIEKGPEWASKQVPHLKGCIITK